MSRWIESNILQELKNYFSQVMAHVQDARQGQRKEETLSGRCPCSPCRRAVGEVTGHDTFHGLGRLDELGDGAGHAFGVDGQVLLQIVGGLVDDLRPRGQTRSRPLRFPFSLFFLWCGIFFPRPRRNSRSHCLRFTLSNVYLKCSPLTLQTPKP